ncbi:DUF1343 domain-containing protein [Deltaproteobacteria bacterium Smac51]|nr:DUF1343 domain-containing protein [Deltaproteobacteria bacterium Smac51]
MKTVIGLEKFIMKDGMPYQKARLGLLANQASVGHDYVHAIELIDEALPGAVAELFGPQHGWAGEKQDNMVESAHGRDRQGRPVYSLYGETRRPTAEMLAGLDALVVDLVDVGTRVYTFAHTMSHCLEEAGKAGLEVIILDRPNPIGGVETEGNLLSDNCRSFVGLHPIPMRHGLTLGELALLINRRLEKPAPLKIVGCEGWRREMYFTDTSLPWVYPSPNLPTLECAWVYPGQVLWEGTNISEARGTTRPFNLVGAPFIDAEKLFQRLKMLDLPGFKFREADFQPTFHKWAGEMCHGLELFPVDKSFKPYLTSLAILQIILEEWPDDFKLKEPPYEYEFDRRPIDLILGRTDIFDRLASGESAESVEKTWLPDLERFNQTKSEILLY